MSENNNREGGNRGRRRRPSGQRHSNSRHNNRNRNRNRNRNNRRGPKLTGVELALNKHQNLLEQYLTARRKYFELFDRADKNQKAKLERNYLNSCQKLREFEEGLGPEEKVEFYARSHESSPDTIYSENNNLEPNSEVVPFEGDFEDIHLLSTQKTDYAHDTEESVGTMEDYEAYKAEVS